MKFLASLSSTLFAAVVIAAPALAQPSKATETLRIGYQKYGSADLVYVANQPPAPAAEAIVVPKDSPLKSVADLKGRKVALNKGSNVHYLLVKALQQAGVKYTDVQTVFLPPADARAAFERGAVDAWVIWDPFVAAAEKQLGARVLADGNSLVSNHQFGLDVAIAEVSAQRFAYGIQPISAPVAAEQQKIADTFAELKLIPKPIRIADALPGAAR